MPRAESACVEIRSLVVRLAGIDASSAGWLAEELGRRLAEELAASPLRSAAAPAEIYVRLPADTSPGALPRVIARRIRMEMP